MAYEEDGETTVLFRKKLSGGGGSDHDIAEDEMHVIWAVGQEPEEFFHSPK